MHATITYFHAWLPPFSDSISDSTVHRPHARSDIASYAPGHTPSPERCWMPPPVFTPAAWLPDRDAVARPSSDKRCPSAFARPSSLPADVHFHYASFSAEAISAASAERHAASLMPAAKKLPPITLAQDISAEADADFLLMPPPCFRVSHCMLILLRAQNIFSFSFRYDRYFFLARRRCLPRLTTVRR
jgi:hypothetical protein